MKGLLLKDFYVLMSQLKTMTIMLVIFCILIGESMSIMAIVYATILPITAMAYDEQCKWKSLAAMMPYSKSDLILSKYILGYVLIFIATLFAVAVMLSSAIIKGNTINNLDLFMVLGAATAANIMITINMPLIFKLGVEKSRIIVMISIVGISIMGAYAAPHILLFISGMNIHPYMVGALGVAVIIMMNIISIIVSTRIYSREK